MTTVAAAGRAAASAAAGAGWHDARRLLYHGIPARILARSIDADQAGRCWQTWSDAAAVFNRFADSELARLNALPVQDGARLSPLLAWGLRAALRAWRLSAGACDATAGSLCDLWREAIRRQRWPDAEELAQARARLGAHRLAVDETGILRCGGHRAVLDLGGIIKGALVDLVDGMLLRMGVRDALVQLGGETSCRGRSPRGAPWRIGVQHPVAADAVWTVITAPATGLSCSTSGDYRRDGRIGDQPVSHLIDPRSGLPACDDLLGATVAIREPGRVADAEALTKAAVFLPPAASIGAAASVSAELLVLRADEAGIEQIASPGWSRLAAP